MQYKYAILNIVIYNILSQTKRGGKWSIGYSATLPLPPNDKMKPLLFFFTYDYSLLPTMRKTIQEKVPKPKILQRGLQ